MKTAKGSAKQPYCMDDELDKADAAARATDVRFSLEEVEKRIRKRVESYGKCPCPDLTAVRERNG